MKIYVSNLGFLTGNEELEKLFASYGKVSSAAVITDRETNKSRGFGFVEMENNSEAEKAIKELNHFYFQGKSITVSEARAKEKITLRKQFNNFWK